MLPRHGTDAWTHILLTFAALVLVPLALDLLTERNDAARAATFLGWVRLAQFPAAVLLMLACWLQAGLWAALLALPWLGVTGLLAAAGALRIWRHGVARPLDRLCTDAGSIFALIGGLWTLAERAGWHPLKFDAVIVGLTAVHFHYAGLLLPIFTGLALRRTPDSRFGARAAVGVVLGVPAVALGIAAKQLGFGPALETAAGVGLALAATVVGIAHVRAASDTTVSALPKKARLLLLVAGISLCLGMVLAALYALRPYAAPLANLGIPQMRLWHGTINALGFGLCGVLGWRAARATASA